MDNIDIPILKKSYELYKMLYETRKTVSKQDRFTTWQHCENIVLTLIEMLLMASQVIKSEKLPILEKASVKLNLLRVFIRLMKEVKTIDNKKYVSFQQLIDEIGRMLGGWIKMAKE